MARTRIPAPFWTRRRVRAVSLGYWALLLLLAWYLPWKAGRDFRAQCARLPGTVVLPSYLAHEVPGMLSEEVRYVQDGDTSFLTLKDEGLPIGTPVTVLRPREEGRAFVAGTDSWFDYARLDLLLLFVIGGGLFRLFRIAVSRSAGSGRVILPGGGDRLERTGYPKGYFDE